LTAALATSLAACAARWELTVGEPMSGGLVGSTFACTTRAGDLAVLEVVPATADAFAPVEHEAAALRAWSGHGAVELLDFAAELRALLTRRVLPGEPLTTATEMEARHHVAVVLRKLHQAVAPAIPLRPLAEVADQHLAAKLASSGPARSALERVVAEARTAARLLARTAERCALLHGDLMDKNLLRDGAGVLAIDPMPHVGDPHADIGFWAANRPPATDIDARAADVASRVGLDPARAACWAATYAVGAACETWRGDTAELRHRALSPREER
jgi:streptomycin 6-kinase